MHVYVSVTNSTLCREQKQLKIAVAHGGSTREHCIRVHALGYVGQVGLCRPTKLVVPTRFVYAAFYVAAVPYSLAASVLHVHGAMSTPPEAWRDAIASPSILHSTFVSARDF
jgi:hypothetical protein